MREYTKNVSSFMERYRNIKTAQAMSRATKNTLKFLGIRLVDLKNIFKTIFQNYPMPKIDDTKNIIREFFSLKEREYLYFGIALFAKRKKMWTKTDIVFIESLLLTKPAWDTIETITSELVSAFAKIYPNTAMEFLNSWSQSKNPWLKSSAIMYQRSFKADTNPEILHKFIVENMNTDNLIINKSIGSALRDYSKTDYEWVTNFVVQNSSQLDKVAKHEAIKWINKKGLI